MYRFMKIILLLWILMMCQCAKSSFLDVKPNTSIVVPTTLDDMTQLLDNLYVMGYNSPISGLLSGDDYYYPTKEAFNSAPTNVERNYYIWKKDIYEGNKNIEDWNAPYKAILYSNIVLEAFENMSEQDKDSEAGRFVKGWALFDRGLNYFNLVQTFSPAYEVSTAQNALGVPLRLSSDINKVVQRASLQQTYDQIILDVKSSANLFANTISLKNPNRPSKSAAYALLARVYLAMNDYVNARTYSDSSLNLYDELLDYNTLDEAQPFTDFNPEVLVSRISTLTYSTIVVGYGSLFIDTILLKSFDENDLRKQLFFKETKEGYMMKSGYNGVSSIYPFTGIAVDEVYLIKSESESRLGNLTQGLQALNKLLVKRYKKDTFIPYNSTSNLDVINKIILERRKELVWRGIRWSDLKRLNSIGANISLRRDLDGSVYTLSPNDPRYVMPIPDDEIALSHLQQNER